MINYFRLVYTLLFSFRVVCVLGLRGGVNILLEIKVLSRKGGAAATELKFGETSFAQIEKGRDGEWNKKRNLAPGFIREEETRVSCCYLRCVIGGRGGEGCVSGQIHTRENGERGPRERQEEHFKISILFCFSSF